MGKIPGSDMPVRTECKCELEEWCFACLAEKIECQNARDWDDCHLRPFAECISKLYFSLACRNECRCGVCLDCEAIQAVHCLMRPSRGRCREQ